MSSVSHRTRLRHQPVDRRVGPSDQARLRIEFKSKFTRNGLGHEHECPPKQMSQESPTKMLKSTSRLPSAIYLFAITILMLLPPPDYENMPVVEAGLIRIYHKLKTPSSQVNQTDPGHLMPAASSSAQEVGDTSRTSIEISSSPMRKIMDLIGQHAPVIVLDSSGEDTAPPGHPQPQASTLMGPVTGAQQGPSSSGESIPIGDSNLPQQQQQHWTILDTGQLQQQQQQQLQQQIQFQQQQQPLAQPQQLFQSTVPNEQYFTFTPFGLAPTSNPFAGQVPQDQSPYLTYPGQQFQGQQFGAFPSQPQLSQQSSQNQQQMAQQQQQQPQNEIQPVFLSSYVPELPSPTGSQQQVNPFVANQNPSIQNRLPQQQPNSIQQIQQAQAQQERAGGDGSGESEIESPPSARKKDDGDSDSSARTDESEPDDADKRQHSGESDDSGEPGEKSISYEDKFDSDKDEEPERSSSSVRRKSSSNNQQVAATRLPARRTIRDNGDGRGFASVGLNDDCLQCICRASTGCDEMARCITIGAEEKYCGPFWLTEEYWQRAGSPQSEPNSMSPFEDCANDIDCAAQTVTKYMWKYKRDCDGDKLMTCIDYARLHKLKPDECAQSDQMDSKDYQEYWGKFMNCADGYNRTRNADDESFKKA